MIFQDGGGFVSETGAWHAPTVFDNLIQQGAMPVTIGIFIDPGVLPAHKPNQMGRYNRSYEYDGLGGLYARFLLEEIIPEVSKQYKISADPNDRGISGSSSGGIAAFTAAWEHPEAFHRVLSFIGSYTDLRGGDVYPSLIRKMEPKPLRLFFQDGSNDQNIYAGWWYQANQAMVAALEFAGYDVKFVVGTEGHNSKHGAAILPDALRWLWREYPNGITTPKAGPRSLMGLWLDPASDWEEVGHGYQKAAAPAVDKEGNIFFADTVGGGIYKIDPAGKVSLFQKASVRANGLAVGPDGRLYAAESGRNRIVAYAPDGSEAVVAEKVNASDLAVTSRGEIYFIDPATRAVWFMDAKHNKRAVFEAPPNAEILSPGGLRLSPDEFLLNVSDSASKWVWSFEIQDDGSLANAQPFHHLETLDDSSATGAAGMAADTEGYLYAATRLGIQVCDQPGRVNLIIRKPGDGAMTGVAFGGPEFQTLYATVGGRVYRRRTQRKGALPWQPVQPPKPRL
jgi:sugar lactone lactonase YvrE/enterochelin esterase-like enzyme